MKWQVNGKTNECYLRGVMDAIYMLNLSTDTVAAGGTDNSVKQLAYMGVVLLALLMAFLVLKRKKRKRRSFTLRR